MRFGVRRRSLRAKIIAWAFVPTGIILLAVALFNFYAYQRVTEELVIERDNDLTRLTAGQLSMEVSGYVDIVSVLVRAWDIYKNDPTAQRIVSDLVSDVVNLRTGETGRAYLVDSSGRVIYHSDAAYIGEDFSTLVAVREAVSGKSGAMRTHDLEGRAIVVSYAPIRDTPWSLVAEASWAEAIRPSQGYRGLLVLLLTLGVAVPTLVVAVGVRWITRPIAELTSAAQEVARGNFDQRINVATGDELEELAEQFNLMAAQLHESYAHLESRVADRTKQLATLNAIGASVNESLDLDETLNRALDELLSLLNLDVGEIRLLNQESNELIIRTQRGLSADFIRRADRRKATETLPGQVALSGRPAIEEDVFSISKYPLAKEEGLRALAIFPLRAKGRTLGTLSLATKRGPRWFTRAERELLRAVSDLVGTAIERGRLFEAEQRRADQFRVISEVGRRMTSMLAVEELFKQMAELIKEAFDYYQVTISLVEGDEVVVKAGAGPLWGDLQSDALRLKVGQDGITGWVAATGDPLLVPDVNREPRYRFMPRASATRSELAVPIKAQETVIGVLDVQSDHLNAFDESDLVVLQSLAHQAAIVIQNAGLYEQAQRLAVVEERNRLARDLHDAVTQALYAVTLYAEAAARLLSTGHAEMAAEHVRDLGNTAQQALREMRLLIFELRPPVLETDGLEAALHGRLEAVEGRGGLETHFHSEGEGELSPEVEGGLYRIAQEALNNALRHAQARNITVSLRRNAEAVVMEVSDDGIGFDPSSAQEKGGLGLCGMAERAACLGGDLTVESQPGKGTSVRVEVHR